MRTTAEVLKDIIVDVNAMRVKEGELTEFPFFGPFMGYQSETDEGFARHNVEWPNLDLLVKEAETILEQGKP